jgi:hypothetical protein
VGSVGRNASGPSLTFGEVTQAGVTAVSTISQSTDFFHPVFRSSSMIWCGSSRPQIPRRYVTGVHPDGMRQDVLAEGAGLRFVWPRSEPLRT